MQPKVSVVVPVYNGAEYLAACLDSVVQQDYPAVELIVVDDGSTDNSADIAASYPDVMLLRQSSRGAPCARNAGLAAATGICQIPRQ